MKKRKEDIKVKKEKNERKEEKYGIKKRKIWKK